MDKYSVKLSPRALRDLDGIYSYIARTLLDPETALKLVDTITEEILSLDSMPHRCPERKTTQPNTKCEKQSFGAAFCYAEKEKNEYDTP